MLNFHGPAAAAPGPIPPAWSPSQASRYCGPDRRSPVPTLRQWLAAALDELDYGVLLLTRDADILHVNHAAVAELDAGHPLQRVGRQLRARMAQDVSLLHDALRNASQRQLRKLVTFGEGANRVGVSVVPLGADGEAARDAPILLVLGKRSVCESLSVDGFARSHRLTGAETRVLTALCRGVPPTRIAEELGVAISTVRTQIGTIRAKTGAESIRALVRQVAQLPPLMGVLRHMAASIAERPAHALGAWAAEEVEAKQVGVGSNLARI